MNYKDLFSLKNKTALVTGAVGILGKEFCTALAEHGANVVVVDLDKDEAATFAALLSKKYKINAIGVQCDVSDPESVDQMLKGVMQVFNEIHILHNNAACKSKDLKKYFQSFETYDLQTWQEIMAVNVNGMFLVAQTVGRQMLAQKEGGSIIQTASIYGVMAPDQRIYKEAVYLDVPINTPAVYSVSKAAVIGLTKYLAAYWADKKIRVNSITPGGVESGQNNTFIENYAKRVPMGRMAMRSEIVGALLYLASSASSYVTGQNIIVDGGLSVW